MKKMNETNTTAEEKVESVKKLFLVRFPFTLNDIRYTEGMQVELFEEESDGLLFNNFIYKMED